MNPLRLIPFALLALPMAGQGLDSAQMRYRDALVAVRDALTPIGAGLQSVRRDLTTAADVTIQAKIGRLRAACREAQGALGAQRPIIQAATGNTQVVLAGRQLVAAMRVLDRHLTAECLEGLATRDGSIVADSVRAWMPYRARRLRDADQAYHEAAATFARAVGVRIPPVNPRGQ